MRTQLRVLALALAVAACDDGAPVPVGPSSQPGTGVAFASANATQTFREPLTFTLTPETCPQLTTVVTGTGESHVVVHESADGSGGVHFSFSNTVKGTAVGEDGSTWKFSYQLNEHDTKEAEPPFTVAFVDKFLLLGDGGAPNIKVKIYNQFVVNPDGSFTDLKVRIRGEPGCDAI